MILLGFHFLAASFLHSAWVSVFLGILQGCSAAIFTTRTTSGVWALGYGLGSLVGGIVVEVYGAHWLFWVMASSMLFWIILVALCKG
jgi:predicted MFS family arabinose efflux permease